MGDLYLDNIEDQRTYPDATILGDIRALVKSGVREGPLIDYKSDVSEKDNWPETAAAYANSFGGLIIFGIDAAGDQPQRVTGFDPKGVEIKTKLANLLLSRIRPRPDFAIRVVRLDDDPNREVAIVRIAEGRIPPYVHSKGEEHRIYLRITARKVEADYLQLMSLIEKRHQAELRTEPPSSSELFGGNSNLYVTKPNSNHISPDFYKFVLVPRGFGGDLRLNLQTETLLIQCVSDLGGTAIQSVIRTRTATAFLRSNGLYYEQRFGIATRGGVAFISPLFRTKRGAEEVTMFVPIHFCEHLLEFLSVSLLFYERAARFYGSCVLDIGTWITDAKLFSGFPKPGTPLNSSDLFHPPLGQISGNSVTQIDFSLFPVTPDRLIGCLENVLIDISRPVGSVLHGGFKAWVTPIVDKAIERIHSARAKFTATNN